MYCNFFGFSEKPFNVEPDPRFLYLKSSHREIFETLSYAIRERRGIITILGEAGTGKTICLRGISEKLENNVKKAIIYNTDMTLKQMLINVISELGLIGTKKNLSKMEAIHLLNDFVIKQFAEGGNVVIFIDEAQNLSYKSLENFRLLSNLETPKHKLIQIVLFGQFELDEMLRSTKLSQLNQRISIKRHIRPFNEDETNEYIAHRLAIVKYKNSKLFDPGAIKLIWNYSKGIPLKINVVCENALFASYALKNKSIEKTIVKKIIRNLNYNFSTESISNSSNHI